MESPFRPRRVKIMEFNRRKKLTERERERERGRVSVKGELERG